MKVLLITGTLAADTIRDYANQSSLKPEVFTIKVPVAAFLTPQTIVSALENKNLDGFDLILVPGLVRGDTKAVFDAIHVPTFKGPRYAADLPAVLELLQETKLSTVTPACDLIREKLETKALQELEKVEQNRARLLKKPGNILIKNLAVGKDFPMRVLAEIVDAALMDKEEIQRIAKQYVKLGADIIDLGMVAGESRPSDAKRIVAAVKEVVDVPVSIDSLNPPEIEAAVSAGVDLILSADAGNIQSIAPFSKKVAVVVIPTNQREGFFPKKAQERVKLLEQIIAQAKCSGVSKILADLVLEPSDILESFIAFREFAQRNPNVPLFVGVSNVTELMDADSVGVNALLARLSSEVNASVLLATEKSDKAKGTVGEEIKAAKMMFLAKKRGSVPKDLGINLLVLKDKRNREEHYNRKLEINAPVTFGEEKSVPAVLDTKGSFKIFIDRLENSIVALHFAFSETCKPTNIIKGKNAEGILSEITKLGLVSRIDHAGYLGTELAKAEIALRTGKEYIQDHTLF